MTTPAIDILLVQQTYRRRLGIIRAVKLAILVLVGAVALVTVGPDLLLPQ
jgi:hypothetical protein